VVVARATVSAHTPPLEDDHQVDLAPRTELVGARSGVAPEPGVREPAALARRSDLHAARRQRRRDALVGLSVLAAALGTTVAILDTFH
jgi:hypothetical protein